MKLAPQLVAAGWLLLGASALFGRQPMPLSGPMQEILPAPEYVEGEPLLDPTNDENFWGPPPMPPLPYGFTWDGYAGAAIEHDIYGYQRLHPPPRKTVSCYGLFVGLADSVHVMFSYPTPHRPPPMYCPKGGGRCVPGKFSYGTRTSCSGGCACQSQPAAIVYEPAHSAPQPVPMPEPAPTYQPRITPPRNVVQPRSPAPCAAGSSRAAADSGDTARSAGADRRQRLAGRAAGQRRARTCGDYTDAAAPGADGRSTGAAAERRASSGQHAAAEQDSGPRRRRPLGIPTRRVSEGRTDFTHALAYASGWCWRARGRSKRLGLISPARGIAGSSGGSGAAPSAAGFKSESGNA